MKGLTMSGKRSARQGVRFNSTADLSAHRPALWFAIQLMMSRNAVVAALRWHGILVEHGSENPIEGIACVVTISGLCGETIRCLRDGMRRQLLLRRMVDHDAELAETWDAISPGPPPKPVDLLLTARDNCFGHFDERVAKRFLKVVESAPARFSFVQTSSEEDPTYKNSWYQWGSLAIVHHLNKGDLSPDAFKATLMLAAEWDRRIAQLANHLLDTILDETGLPTEYVPGSDAGSAEGPPDV